MRLGRPWHWFLLNIPFGATSGFVTVTLGYLAHEAKMLDEVVTTLGGFSLLPHTWKFFWAPIADITMTRKRWYVVSNVISCLTILTMGFIPFTEANLGTFKALIFVNALAITFLGMAVEALMAHATSEELRGRASGWFQAGNLGGNGLGGGVALIVATNVSIQAAFVALAAILASCMLALRLVPDVMPEKQEGTLGQKVWRSLASVAKDVGRTLFTSRRGVVALVLCFMPLGAGAAVYLFGAIGTRWGADENLVGLTSGLLGGLIAVPGCLVGGWMSDRMKRRVAYAVSGVILAGVAAIWAVMPQTAASYVVFVLAYQFASGLVYGTFTGFVLETIGVGAVATKYNALASLSNIPIWYMSQLLGWVSTKYGPVKMLFADAVSGIIGLVVLVGAILIIRPGKAPPPASAPTA